MNKLWKKLPALLAFSFFAVTFAACTKENVSKETSISESVTIETEDASQSSKEETAVSSLKEDIVTEATVEEESVKEEEASKEEPSAEEKTEGELAAPSNSGKLHVEGTKLCDEKGNAVQLKGLSTHGIAWFPAYVNNELFKEFRTEWNCNVVRIAMYSDEYGGYANGGDKDNLKKLVKNGVEYATANDMYVIIDWHILADGNPNTHKADAKTFFKEMSSLYADYNNVLYEICNEPNGGTDWKTIKSYAEEVIPVIRANDSDAIIIVGTPNWSQEVDKASQDPIKDYDNIMYALHFYADTHKDDLRNKMVAAINSGLPIFVTEYGICDASGNGAINEAEAAKWMSVMNEYMVSSCAWNISNKSETSAIFASWTSKTYGFSDEDLSSSGKWVYSMLTGKTKYEPSGRTEAGTAPAGGGEDTASVSETKTEGEVTKLTVGDLLVVLKLANSWEGEDGNHYQYEMTIVNNGADVSGWKLDVPFNGNIKLEQGWCASYKANGSTLHIENESYNGSIAKGGSTKDIGFIIIGPKSLKAGQ